MRGLFLFWLNIRMPSGAAEGAVVEKRRILITSKLAIFAERSEMEPVAVGVEVIFGIVFVPFYLVFAAKDLSLFPSFRFDAE